MCNTFTCRQQRNGESHYAEDPKRSGSALRKEQAGFHKSKSTVEQIFILRNILKQVNKWQATLYTHFIDFEKAFDSIHREGMWRIIKDCGFPNKLIRMVKITCDDFEYSVLDEVRTDKVV